MKLKIFIVAVITTTAIAFTTKDKNNNDDPCIKLQYYFQLKQKTAATYWKDFNGKKLYGPMMFYGEQSTYVINANEILLQRIKKLPFSNCLNGVTLNKIATPTDTIHLNMQVDYDEADSSLLYYKNAIASVSDINTAKKFVPNISDTEFWMAMILHENFHLYQTSHPKFKACQNTTQEIFQRDTLLYFYNHLPWYKNSIAAENQLITNAIDTDISDSAKIYIRTYLEIKKARQQLIQDTFHTNIAPLEDMLERSEGIARYMEYCMKRIVKTMPQQIALQSIDSSYHYGTYNNYQRKDDKVMTGISSQYFYATGLNLAVLFEKLHINYQTTMYADNRTFNWYLQKYIR